MAIITLKDLPAIREKHKKEKIVFCSGTFDLTHAGHILFFEDCKKHGDILVVLVGSDHNLKVYNKGPGRPILNEHVRLKTVDSLKPVDYALLDPDVENNDMLGYFPELFRTFKPDFYIVNKDAFDLARRYELVEGTPTKIIVLERTCPPEFNEISTSKIIEKIQSVPKKSEG